jgi:hypothetical protein
MGPTSTRLGLVTAAALALLSPFLLGGDASDAGPGRHTRSPATGSAPAVPGGAAVSVRPGSPPICAALAGSRRLRGLGGIIDRLAISAANSTDAAAASADLRELAAELRGMATTADDGLRAPLADLAAALEGLAGPGLADEPTVDAVADRLVGLGSEVQARCGFAVG